VYSEGVEPYAYKLPCGVVYKSYTPSVADNDGRHHILCRRCGDHVLAINAVVPASRRDMALVDKIDRAIVQDRIVADIRRKWDEEPYEVIATKHGVSRSTVLRIASRLGVVDYGTLGDTVLE
jgi:hypothetical protein